MKEEKKEEEEKRKQRKRKDKFYEKSWTLWEELQTEEVNWYARYVRSLNGEDKLWWYMSVMNPDSVSTPGINKQPIFFLSTKLFSTLLT